MKKTIAALSTLSVLGLGAVAVEASQSDSPRSGRQVVRVGSAGTVDLSWSKGRLRIADVDAARGWKVVEARSTDRREVDVTFRKGGRVLEFEADLAGGRVWTDIVRRGVPRVRSMETGVQSVAAGPAGSVSVQFANGGLSIVDVDTNDGWTVTERRADGTEVDVEFVNGGQKVDLEIDIANGELAIDLEIESTDGEPATDGTYEFPAGEAGSITVSLASGALTLVSTAPAAGWDAGPNTSDDLDEVEVEFSRANEQVEVSVEIENGRFQVEVEADNDDNDDDDDDDDDSDDD